MPNMVYRGAWDYCTDYKAGDCADYNGSVYLALKQSAGK